jgi:hypothetical protein
MTRTQQNQRLLRRMFAGSIALLLATVAIKSATASTEREVMAPPAIEATLAR